MNIQPVMPDKILDFEKSALFVRITQHVGKALNIMKSRGWKQRELEENFGIPGPLVTVYGNWKKYKRKISEDDFRKCLQANIVTMDGVLHNCVETDKELKFLQEFK